MEFATFDAIGLPSELVTCTSTLNGLCRALSIPQGIDVDALARRVAQSTKDPAYMLQGLLELLLATHDRSKQAPKVHAAEVSTYCEDIDLLETSGVSAATDLDRAIAHVDPCTASFEDEMPSAACDLVTAAAQKPSALDVKPLPMMAAGVVPPTHAPPPGHTKLSFTVYDMPSIDASSSIHPSAPDDLQLHIDTGTSASLLHGDVLRTLWGNLSASPHFEYESLNEPLQFQTACGTFAAHSYVRAYLRIGSGVYHFTFFVTDDLPVSAILGYSVVATLGIRFNHSRRMVRLKLPRSWLAPGCSQPANSRGELMSCQWVPMYCAECQYALW